MFLTRLWCMAAGRPAPARSDYVAPGDMRQSIRTFGQTLGSVLGRWERFLLCASALPVLGWPDRPGRPAHGRHPLGQTGRGAGALLYRHGHLLRHGWGQRGSRPSPSTLLRLLTAGLFALAALAVSGSAEAAAGNATGNPSITGTATQGQQVTAGWGNVNDPDRLSSGATTGVQDATVHYTWLRCDLNGNDCNTTLKAEQAVPTSNGGISTYTLTAAEVGLRIRVRMEFVDYDSSGRCNFCRPGQMWVGNVETRTSFPWPARSANQIASDSILPTVSSATVAGTSLVITFDRDLGAAANLANSAFTVKVGGSSVTLSGTDAPVISGPTVTLTLATAVAATDTVTVSYTKPSTGSNNTLVDAGGDEAATFEDQPMTNTAPPTLSSATVTGTSLVLTFSEDLGAAANLATSAFTVKVGGAAVSLSGTPVISGPTVTVTLATAVMATDTVTVAYTQPGSGSDNTLVDTGGNTVATFGDQSVDNITPNTVPTAVDGTVTTNEDTAYTFTAADFNFMDSDTDDTLASVKIFRLPLLGSLKLNMVNVSVNDTVTTPQLENGSLTYTPPANAHGTSYTSFTFTVNDGTDDSTLTYTMTLNVTVQNDPAMGVPTITVPNVFRVPAVLSVDLSGIADADGLPNSFTYQWQRFAADGTTFEANLGTDATYPLTAAEAGKKLKVAVRFTDEDNTSEGPLTSAAYPTNGTVQAAATCAAPTLGGGATLIGTG